MKQLKDIGFGKSSMEDMILDEVEDLSQLLLKVKIHTGCLFSEDIFFFIIRFKYFATKLDNFLAIF